MIPTTIPYSSGITQIYFDAAFDLLKTIVPPETGFVITDENLMRHYEQQLKPWNCIVIPPGETAKSLETIGHIIRRLIDLGADRNAVITGIGGGVVTDIAGFAACIYKRGVRFGFMPTSVLGMVDASVGGKNGVDAGVYKNMIGIIRQPDFLIYNYAVLKSLPEEEWINGFAEIIKHACIRDADLFYLLEQYTPEDFRNNQKLFHQIIERNVLIKTGIVQDDETEKGTRKLLNFGHTFGHAVEYTQQLPHGHAVAVGMVIACMISEMLLGFPDTERVKKLIAQYLLPTSTLYNPESVMAIMAADKKRFGNNIDYILPEHIGKAVIHKIAVEDVRKILREINRQ